jgi:hypothetical protein
MSAPLRAATASKFSQTRAPSQLAPDDRGGVVRVTGSVVVLFGIVSSKLNRHQCRFNGTKGLDLAVSDIRFRAGAERRLSIRSGSLVRALRMTAMGDPPSTLVSGGILEIPDRDPNIREKEFGAAVPRPPLALIGSQTNNHVSGTSALHPTPEETTQCQKDT